MVVGVPAHTFLLHDIKKRVVWHLNHVNTAKEISYQYLMRRKKFRQLNGEKLMQLNKSNPQLLDTDISIKILIIPLSNECNNN